MPASRRTIGQLRRGPLEIATVPMIAVTMPATIATIAATTMTAMRIKTAIDPTSAAGRLLIKRTVP
jgi:hypothetical protein